jgi:nucleotide-binding universal stress UspA family protein
MYQNILVPVDGSESSELALTEAIRLAQGLGGSTLHLLHIVDEFAIATMNSTRLTPSYYSDLLSALRAAGRRVLDSAAAKVRDGGLNPTASCIETFGRTVAEVIVDKAKELPAELIVMGTHGRRGLRRLVMGSDAEGVLRSTPVPVLMVRGVEGRS